MATAQSEKKQTVKATEAGVSTFITKPFSKEELHQAIEETFGVKKEIAEESLEDKERRRKTASGKVRLNVAHIQITDHLTLGVLKNFIEEKKFAPQHFELTTRCMPSWNLVQQALEKGDVDAAFILAPIAMDLFSFGTPIKLVLFAHKNGSISVRKKNNDNGESLKEFCKGKSFYIPHILSIHHMLSNMFLREIGLNPGVAGREDVDVFFEVVPPIKMPEFLSTNSDVCGYTVAEPLGTKAIASGIGDLLFLSGELWEYHPCCVVAMRDDFIDAYPDAVQEFANMLVESGQFISQNPETAAKIAVDFLDPGKKLGLKVRVLENVLKEPQGIKTDDLFPIIEDLDRIQRYMSEEMGFGTLIDLEKFVDTRFARIACDKMESVRHVSHFHDLSKKVPETINRQSTEYSEKAMLDREGKYLIFDLDDQQYGIGIASIREIIGMMPIRTIPQTPREIKGVINLRGKVIPVIDLRLKFGMEALEYSDRTCIIILEARGKNGDTPKGIVVDAVSHVHNIKNEDIEDTPLFGAKVHTDFILAMAKIDKGVKTLLNTHRLFSGEETQIMSDMI